jgi:xanthine dehydrogenase iron-sulfur cluster and FAD-binding subunit A
MTNTQTKNNLIAKLKSAKEVETFITNSANPTSVKQCLQDLTTLLKKNPDAVIIVCL